MNESYLNKLKFSLERWNNQRNFHYCQLFSDDKHKTLLRNNLIIVDNPINIAGYPKKTFIFNSQYDKTYPCQRKNNFQDITNPQVQHIFEVIPKR